MMQEFSPENFWWNNITGPSAMIASAENALSEGYSIILGVPAFTPWPEKMRNILHGNLSGGDVYITIIDADSECPGTAEDFLLSKYDTHRKYRSRLSSVQEFFLRNNLLKNHIFWVHNFRNKPQVSDWLNFCAKYPSDSPAKGLFILDTEHENLLPSGRMRAVNFSDYAERYDTMIFASFLLDNKQYSRPQYNRNWKHYISSLAAMLCGSDSEVAERFIRSGDFTCTEPSDVLEMIADDFPKRRRDSTHILGMIHDGDESAVTNRIWTAQVQVFFPMIELARVRIISSDDDLARRIQFALEYLKSHDNPMTLSDGKIVEVPEDLDLGGLFHLVCRANMIKTNDIMLNEYIALLRSFRNSLAHMTPCKAAEVCELIDFERHYENKS